MPSYTFQIRKADHISPDGTSDLHVHVYFNEGRSRKLIGRYRLPSLEPIFPGERELTNREISFLANWLAEPRQQRKLQSILDDSLFDLHKVAGMLPEFSEIQTDEGQTYLVVRLPVAARLR